MCHTKDLRKQTYCLFTHATIMVLFTTQFAIQNGINQPCRVNTFWFMDHYVTKFEKRHCHSSMEKALVKKMSKRFGQHHHLSIKKTYFFWLQVNIWLSPFRENWV